MHTVREEWYELQKIPEHYCMMLDTVRLSEYNISISGVWEETMEYISVKEASKLWCVSERWVQKFCAEERIPGVLRFGRSWMIPKNAERPNDLRRKQEKSLEEDAC